MFKGKQIWFSYQYKCHIYKSVTIQYHLTVRFSPDKRRVAKPKSLHWINPFLSPKILIRTIWPPKRAPPGCRGMEHPQISSFDIFWSEKCGHLIWTSGQWFLLVGGLVGSYWLEGGHRHLIDGAVTLPLDLFTFLFWSLQPKDNEIGRSYRGAQNPQYWNFQEPTKIFGFTSNGKPRTPWVESQNWSFFRLFFFSLHW